MEWGIKRPEGRGKRQEDHSCNFCLEYQVYETNFNKRKRLVKEIYYKCLIYSNGLCYYSPVYLTNIRVDICSLPLHSNLYTRYGTDLRRRKRLRASTRPRPSVGVGESVCDVGLWFCEFRSLRRPVRVQGLPPSLRLRNPFPPHPVVFERRSPFVTSGRAFVCRLGRLCLRTP